MNDASDFQRDLIQDGVLTFTEYERAVLDTVACFSGLGLRVMSAPYLTSPPRPGLILLIGDQYRFYADAEGRELTMEEFGQAQNCSSAFSNVVQALWVELTGPTLADLDAARAELAECLLKEGIAVPASPTRAELMAVARSDDVGVEGQSMMDPTYRSCIEPVIMKYRIHVSGAAF